MYWYFERLVNFAAFSILVTMQSKWTFKMIVAEDEYFGSNATTLIW